VLAVADFGGGIPSNVRSSLDDRLSGAEETMRRAFTQGNTTTKQIYGPRGMGLDLLKEFVRLNSGKLEIYSHDGYVCIDNTGQIYENFPVFSKEP
jgi:hypothetical protein